MNLTKAGSSSTGLSMPGFERRDGFQDRPGFAREPAGHGAFVVLVHRPELITQGRFFIERDVEMNRADETHKINDDVH